MVSRATKIAVRKSLFKDLLQKVYIYFLGDLPGQIVVSIWNNQFYLNLNGY